VFYRWEIFILSLGYKVNFDRKPKSKPIESVFGGVQAEFISFAVHFFSLLPNQLLFANKKGDQGWGITPQPRPLTTHSLIVARLTR
jgi:hypothetical protein